MILDNIANNCLLRANDLTMTIINNEIFNSILKNTDLPKPPIIKLTPKLPSKTANFINPLMYIIYY